MAPLTQTVRAPAKLNLYLHITGRRASDGYHLLDSLVVFTEVADELTIHPADELSLVVDGSFARAAGQLSDNLVLKAALALQKYTATNYGAQLALTKHIPVGAGLGGGSADAAATLRGLNRFWMLGLDGQTLRRIAITLGADVAMCLDSVPAVARGVGDELTPLLTALPPMHVVLVYPGISLMTKNVYSAFVAAPPQEPWVEDTRSGQAFIASLARTCNHLQAVAMRINGMVAEVLLTLETLQPKAPFVRMTGSGSCCYALFETGIEAKKAEEALAKHSPHWWVKATALRAS